MARIKLDEQRNQFISFIYTELPPSCGHNDDALFLVAPFGQCNFNYGISNILHSTTTKFKLSAYSSTQNKRLFTELISFILFVFSTNKKALMCFEWWVKLVLFMKYIKKMCIYTFMRVLHAPSAHFVRCSFFLLLILIARPYCPTN